MLSSAENGVTCSSSLWLLLVLSGVEDGVLSPILNPGSCLGKHLKEESLSLTCLWPSVYHYLCGYHILLPRPGCPTIPQSVTYCLLPPGLTGQGLIP